MHWSVFVLQAVLASLQLHAARLINMKRDPQCTQMNLRFSSIRETVQSENVVEEPGNTHECNFVLHVIRIKYSGNPFLFFLLPCPSAFLDFFARHLPFFALTSVTLSSTAGLSECCSSSFYLSSLPSRRLLPQRWLPLPLP